MSITQGEFAWEVNFNYQGFTPQQVAEYIAGSSESSHADKTRLKKLIERSQVELLSAVKRYGLQMNQVLRRGETIPLGERSSPGDDLADLALKHGDEVIRLIVEAGQEQGVLT